MKSIYALAALTALASPLLAQRPLDVFPDRQLGEGWSPPAFVTEIHTQADDPEGGAYGIWAAGRDYKVSFHDGATFVPFLGSDAPRNHPVTFAPVRVRAGGAWLSLDDDVAPARMGDRVSYDRGAVVELYALEPGGMEQLFVFDAPTPDGALVLAIDVDSELACTSNAPGFDFATLEVGSRS